MKYELRSRYGWVLALLILHSAFCIHHSFGQHLYINLVDQGLGLQAATNRTVLVTGNSLPKGVSSGVVLQDKHRLTTDVAGGCWISNAVLGVYFVDVIKPSFASYPAERTTFYVLHTNTTGITYAREAIVANPGNTYPPDSVAWGAATADARFIKRAELTNIVEAIGGGGVNEAAVKSIMATNAAASASAATNLYPSGPLSVNFNSGTLTSGNSTMGPSGIAVNGGGALNPSGFVGNGAGLTNLTADLVTGNGSITSTNLSGSASGLSNVYAYRATLGGDGENVNPYVVLNATNQSTPPELLYRPGSVSGGAESKVSFTRTKRGIAPRGVSTWNIFGADTNVFTGASVTNLINRMVTNGMVRWGCNDLTLDEGISFRGNGTGTPLYPAAVPFDYSYDANRIWRADTNRFPGGLEAIVAYAHMNGVKVHLYCAPALFGSAGYWMPFGSNHVDMVNNVSNLVNHVGIDGFKFESGFAGSVHEFVNEAVRWGKPVWINSPADNGYEPQFADTVNAWRVGTGLYGDINARVDRLYQWADVANFSMIRPGHVVDFDMLGTHPAYWGIDSPYIKNAGTKYTGSANILAMMMLANANVWYSQLPAYEGGSTRYCSFYEDYNNPHLNAVQSDFTKPVFLLKSNYGAFYYAKFLADGSVALGVQNRMATNKTEVVNFDELFGNHYPTMVQSTNRNLCTVFDLWRGVTLGYYTNTYSASVAYTNIAMLRLTKGISEQYAPGTNFLSDYGWLYVTNYPDNDPGVCVNATYLPYGSGKITINSVQYDKGFYAPVGGDFELKYPLHKQADFFTGTFLNRFYAGGCVFIYTNDVLAFTTGPIGANAFTNIFVGITNADWITIRSTNGFNTAAPMAVGNPLIYCRSQSKLDEQGRQIRLLDKSYVEAVSAPVLAGSGVNITNIGDNVIFFDSLPITGFSRLSPNGPGPSPSTLFGGFSGTGAATRRAYVWVPGYVTNAVFYGMVIQSSAISTWTNLIEPSFQASDGRFVGSGGGLNSSNEVCTIEAANAVSNYTFSVKWPATNVNVKGFQMSFLQATNTSATHYIGPFMRVRYNP